MLKLNSSDDRSPAAKHVPNKCKTSGAVFVKEN
jgi:hypothetical protein